MDLIFIRMFKLHHAFATLSYTHIKKQYFVNYEIRSGEFTWHKYSTQSLILKRKQISGIALGNYFPTESAIKIPQRIPEGRGLWMQPSIVNFPALSEKAWDLFVNLGTQGQVSNQSGFCISSRCRPTTERC